MVLTKAYLRYVQSACFGVVSSLKAKVVFIKRRINTTRKQIALYAVCPALENVIIWDVRRGEKVSVLAGDKHEVTALQVSPDQQVLAVGYEDGSVRLWKLQDNTCQVTFSGHKSAVSVLKFDDAGGRLVSGSRDTDVIVWDTVNEAGLYRFKGHKGLITECYFMKSQNVLVTSSKDSFVKFWDLDTQHCFLTLVGHRSEVWGFTVTHDETRLITGCADSELRVWKINSNSESDTEQLSESSKKNRGKRNAEEAGLDEESDEKQTEGTQLSCTLIGSIFRHSHERVVSIMSDSTQTFLGCLGNDSQLELFKTLNDEEIQKHLQKKLKRQRKKARKENEDQKSEADIEVTRTVEDELQRIHSLKLRSKIKTLCFNADGSCLLSGSQESIKVWNRSSCQPIRTVSTGYALCSLFVPGDKYAIIGTKTGKLEIYDISSGQLLESVDAHDGPVWGLSLSPDKRGFASGSGDSTVKFWEFDLVSDAEHSQVSKRLSITHVQTLKMKEEVLCVKYSPNQRLLAVSLLDCTVKVFFADTLKFFLSLYGHKLPVMALDISSDSNLIITGSADKNIKIWGLDYGDCHKSIFGHDDSIMGLQFVPKTHYFFSVSKDKTLKYWDADKFEHITTLQGHHAEVWCVAVSPDGDYVEREKEYEESLVQNTERVIPGEVDGEAVKAGKKTLETVKAAERLMEAIDLYNEETAKMRDQGGGREQVSTNPILIAHGNITIVANKVLVPVIDSLRQHAKSRVHGLRDTIGFNLAGLRFIQNEMEAREETFFADATEKVKKIRKKQKSTFVQVVK
ncbi:hypothetical protein pdam_00002032 [Pocillopora damicornis]|uniref:Uncharacterized protein n=1 Tax=Pocillopora damicornis TaxID=46731 RepID=A0A3M6TXA7_POCDA|nr:hypothetical protein pdam_00002032 [Pocillopora damicornis]